MKLKPVRADDPLRLGDADARPGKGVPKGRALERATKKHEDRIGALQELLYADKRYALLIVLQGRDAAGKDGTIKKVFTVVNPQGCEVTPFGIPSDDELRHDFLWRIHQKVPRRGMIGIFNRSQYEDVLVSRVRKTVPGPVVEARYGQINEFERMLTANGVVVLKFFLHVSRGEQRKRLQDRLSDPTKNWKFSLGDLDVRAHWNRYTEAYRAALQRCSPKWAPWYVVPADDKKVRNLLIARTIADRLDALDLRFPPASPDVRHIKIR